ncbi:hypothetical protein TNCV_4178301 [Trichonephila clavipes]|nr:hypothetical protein TNCV_4178301 [Trichonephila clavipes]
MMRFISKADEFASKSNVLNTQGNLRILGISTFLTAAFDVLSVKGKETNANETVHFKVDFPERKDIETRPKNSVILDCTTVLSEKFIEVDDNVCTASMMTYKHILEFVQVSKIIMDADFDDENEMNDAGPVHMSSKMRNVMTHISTVK